MESAARTPDTGVSAEMVGRPVRFESRRYKPTDSYADIACDKVRRGSEALGASESELRSRLALVRELLGDWGELPAGKPPERACWIAIDGMPFEVSFAWADGQSELRLAFESPSHPGTPLARQEDGRAFTRGLAGRPGVSIERYLAVEDLFTDREPRGGYFSLAHAVAWRRDGHPLYKIYLNPAVVGREHAAARAEEAVTRLGLARPWRVLADHLGGVHGIAHEPVALALDLSDGREARCKVYLAHSGVTADDIDAQSAVARDHLPGSFARALERVTGRRESGWAKPPVTCWSFSSAQDTPTATLYVPLIPGHRDDAAAHDLVAAFMREENVDPAPYAAALHALADGPQTESATQNFLSYRGGPAPRFAVYVAPGTYRPA
ncbi:hypothetical protein GL263_01120 [Streptomyces durbertensis]|uniref:Tryptophan dimethylallyltransferase n=1 Tax=Streptomyces durbertensis TaxID=2448886 RepID=A0ABR6EA20_9ACTN|nr:tryptophan dimethylallyltransferase family protein [Streptomyces durbertensis]MBB1242185.1 hypothetical protein [Streptomyces durbertensis]